MYIYIYIYKLSLRRKTSVRRREENEKSEKNSIHKACKEIIQYHCCYCWSDLIPGPFHYLTYKKKKKTNLQIAILEKTHKFLVFPRNTKEKKLRRSYKMNMNHYLYLMDYDPSTNTFSFNMHIFGQ